MFIFLRLYVAWRFRYLQTSFTTSSSPEHAENTSPGLTNGRLNLVRRQRETICALITELICVGVGSVTGHISVVGGGASGGVQSRTAGANCVSSAGHSTDGRGSVCRQCAVGRIIIRAGTAVVAVWPTRLLDFKLTNPGPFTYQRMYWP